MIYFSKFMGIYTISLSLMTSCYAGWYSTTSGSIANCKGYNESATWNFQDYNWWLIESAHLPTYAKKGTPWHIVIFPASYTFKASAYHYNEDPPGYTVQGKHYYITNNGSYVLHAITFGNNCQSYDGWHEANKFNTNSYNAIQSLSKQKKYNILIKKSMPLPGTGATVVESNNLMSTKKQFIIVKKFNEAQNKNGYYEHENKKAVALLELPEIAEKEYNDRKLIPVNKNDTHLYETLTNLSLLFQFNSIPNDFVEKIIGYTPENTFIDDGWTGVVEFFIPKFYGVCAYHQISIELTKMSAYIPKEVATYVINNKLTTYDVMGNNETGFVYNVEWWDNKFKKQLECANKNYSEELKNSTIELAKTIDRS